MTIDDRNKKRFKLKALRCLKAPFLGSWNSEAHAVLRLLYQSVD